MLLSRLAIVVVCAAALGACDSSEPVPSRGTGLVGRLADRTAFEPLIDALDATGLSTTLSGTGPYTLFAPTSLAFDYLGEDFQRVILDPSQRELLTRVLRHHIVAERIVPSTLEDGDVLMSIDGLPLTVRRIGPVLEIGGVRVSEADSISADNGVAYPASDVILGALSAVERVRLSPSLVTFERLADRTGALATAAPVTILAPLDDAFVEFGRQRLSQLEAAANDDVLRRLARAHVLPGVPALTPGSTLTALDGDQLQVRSNGTQTTIGGQVVLRVEETVSGRLVLLGGIVMEHLTLGDRLRIEPLFQSYWKDVRDRDPELWGRLNDPAEDLTLFVPSNQRYASLGENVFSALSEPENRSLARRLLRVHVVEGRYPPEVLSGPQTVTTADGDLRQVDSSPDARLYDLQRYSDVDSPASRNGWFYSLAGVVFPRVDAFDTSILRGYPVHARAVRRAGLEPVFRSSGLTAFVMPDSVYLNTPGLITRPDLANILRYNAAFAELPEPGPASFTALNGIPRVVTSFPCPDQSCSPYVIDDSLFVDPIGPSFDQSGYIHALRVFAEPPARRRP